MYAPVDCGKTEVRITPFTGEVIVLRKQPGSYDTAAGTEMWLAAGRGTINDGKAEDGAGNGTAKAKGKTARHLERSLESERYLEAGGVNFDSDAKSEEAVNSEIKGSSKAAESNIFILKPGMGADGACEEMKFIIRRVHGMMYSDYSVV